MTEDRLTAALRDEVKHIGFPEGRKQLLVAELKKAMRPRTVAHRFASRLRDFWNGTTEVRLPTAVAAMLLVGLGLWNSMSPLLVIDVNAASLLLQTATEETSAVTQGVSVIRTCTPTG